MDVGAHAYDFFRTHGYTPAAAAGIVGNFQQESGLNPQEAGGGLDQGQGSRYHPGNLDQQLHGILGELQGSEAHTAQALRGVKGPREAARIFSEKFERPGIPKLENRERYAQEALQRYGGREAAHASAAGAIAGEIAPHLTQPEAGPNSAQSADLVAALQSALAPKAAQGAITAPRRPQSAGGEEQAPGTPRVPQAPQEAPQSDPTAALSILSRLAADASPLPTANEGGTGEAMPHTQAFAEGGGHYVNPLPGFTKGRTDQGVDYSGKPGMPIRAIGDGVVLPGQANWFNGQPYVQYRLTSGPKAGKVVFVAEQITPQVKPGDHIRAGQRIGVYAPSGTALETGYGSGKPGVPIDPYNGRPDGTETGGGKRARAFFERLGAR